MGSMRLFIITNTIALPFYNITYSHRYIAQVITSVLNKHPFLVTACGCAVRQSTYAVSFYLGIPLEVSQISFTLGTLCYN